jgi:hypothetical protein
MLHLLSFHIQRKNKFFCNLPTHLAVIITSHGEDKNSAYRHAYIMTRQIAHNAVETLHSVKKISSLRFGGWADDLLLCKTVNILDSSLVSIKQTLYVLITVIQLHIKIVFNIISDTFKKKCASLDKWLTQFDFFVKNFPIPTHVILQAVSNLQQNLWQAQVCVKC